ncbi:hypothetical protein [Pseudoruegeria sp. SK021]|uniref:hypothetical protein n=1 Tax=Pseudoruegeria sp. SK021 TaxID=1933035 RepID=UPI000A23C7AF|nr:hypothetical protein [Pseudoruegeria sp. SK021]OSP55310.1 hypothetical protein BV911_07690 [Pseudoruegeria sp. SK021]
MLAEAHVKAFSVRYHTSNWSNDNAPLRLRGSHATWFDPDMAWHAETTGKSDLPEPSSHGAIHVFFTMKRPFDQPLRPGSVLVERLL